MTLYEAQKHMRNAPWLAVFPGTAIAVSVLGLNLSGDAVRDAWTPGCGRDVPDSSTPD